MCWSTSLAKASCTTYTLSRLLYWLRSQVSIQKEAMRTISFCWSPMLPLTSMQKRMTAFDSGTSRTCQER